MKIMLLLDLFLLVHLKQIFQVCWYTGYTCVSTFYLKTSGLKTNLPIRDGGAPNLTLHNIMMLVGCMVYEEEQNLLW